MKKKNLNSLKLNKKSISNFNLSMTTGGEILSIPRGKTCMLNCTTLLVVGCVYETAGACTTVGPLCLP